MNRFARIVAALALALLLLPVTAGQPASAQPEAERWEREGWTTDFSRTTVDLGSIFSGGVARDQIPPIDAPAFAPVEDIDDLPDREPVLTFTLNGDARAYPLRIMMWHEIVNDTVGGVPVAVTYCPLCNAAIVFDARIDGKRHTFGTTGKLRHSDLVMYDRATETWWQQFSGEALAGVYVGRQLDMLPSTLQAWGDFRAKHPDGKVLVPNDPAMRQYWRNPYTGYDTSPRPFLYSGALPEGIAPMERVVLVRDGDAPLSVSLALLKEVGELVEGNIRIAWSPGQASALDTSRISEGRDVGTVSVTRTTTGEPVLHDVTFAFVVSAFEPALVIRTEPEG